MIHNPSGEINLATNPHYPLIYEESIIRFRIRCCSSALCATETCISGCEQTFEVRVEDALKRLTVEEKKPCCMHKEFSSPVCPARIPEFWMTDGPHGIRPEVLWDEWNQADGPMTLCSFFRHDLFGGYMEPRDVHALWQKHW